MLVSIAGRTSHSYFSLYPSGPLLGLYAVTIEQRVPDDLTAVIASGSVSRPTTSLTPEQLFHAIGNRYVSA